MIAPRSLRVQLVAAFVGIAGLAVLAAAVWISIVVERSVWDALDSRLAEEAETLGALRAMGTSDLSQAIALIGHEQDLGPGKFIAFIAPTGEVVSGFGAVPPALQKVAARPAHDERIVTDAATRTRAALVPTAGGGNTLIGVRVHHLVHMIRRARIGIGVGGTMLLATLAILAWAITTRATRELDRLADELETIEAGSLDHRLATRHTTEVDRLAAVLNRLLGRLESAVAHLRRFSADAAHELRTPIAALRARLEVGLALSRPAASLRDDLLDALEQTERLERLAETLLALSAVETDASASRRDDRLVDLAGVAREVVDSLEPVAQEQGRSFVLRAPDVVPVIGTADLLKRLVVNLLDNAFRHTPPNAPIELAVGRRNGEAYLRAHDGGPGIPGDEQERVFERFYRGRAARGGTGLGLALCREIVTRHRGAIHLDSRPGAGTTVTVTLPLAPESATA